MRVAVLFPFLLILGANAIAADPTTKVSGIFSNLAYHSESGDLTGWEVTLILQSDSSYFALVQVAEGQAPTF
jgi:hypothetical protein